MYVQNIETGRIHMIWLKLYSWYYNLCNGLYHVSSHYYSILHSQKCSWSYNMCIYYDHSYSFLYSLTMWIFFRCIFTIQTRRELSCLKVGAVRDTHLYPSFNAVLNAEFFIRLHIWWYSKLKSVENTTGTFLFLLPSFLLFKESLLRRWILSLCNALSCAFFITHSG